MNSISLDSSYLRPDVSPELVKEWQPLVDTCHRLLHEKKGPGSAFLGWMDVENIVSQEELEKLLQEAQKLCEMSEILVVIGIGGSYLGARALIEAMSYETPATRKVAFAGYQISAGYHRNLLKELQAKEVCLNIISKSGPTLEPAVSFRLLKAFLEEKYGTHKAIPRIVATTDKTGGILRNMAKLYGYSSFVIPDEVGGRYSVLTPVGLLPIAYAGFDVKKLLEGARDAAKTLENPDIQQNPAYYYAVVRNILYRQGKTVEILANLDRKSVV